MDHFTREQALRHHYAELKRLQFDYDNENRPQEKADLAEMINDQNKYIRELLTTNK